MKGDANGVTSDRYGVGLTHTGFSPSPSPWEAPLAEQRGIVRYLDHVDGRIQRYVAAKEKLAGLLEEERQAVVNRAVTRGSTPTSASSPPVSSGSAMCRSIGRCGGSRPYVE